VETNQIFPILPNNIVAKLYERYDFHEWNSFEDTTAIRLVTSFDTPNYVVGEFLDYLSSITTT